MHCVDNRVIFKIMPRLHFVDVQSDIIRWKTLDIPQHFRSKFIPMSHKKNTRKQPQHRISGTAPSTSSPERVAVAEANLVEGHPQKALGFMELFAYPATWGVVLGLAIPIIMCFVTGAYYVAKIDARFPYLESRFDKVESKLDKLDSRIGDVENRLIKVETKIDNIDIRLIKVENQLSSVVKGNKW